MLSNQPSGDDYSSFHSWWEWIISNFESLLELKYGLLHESNRNLALTKILIQSRGEYAANHESSIIDLHMLFILLKNLEYIKMNRESVFKTFKNVMVSAGMGRQMHHFTGLIFEIRIARYLVEGKFDFCQPDPPDYLVRANNATISLECYAPRISLATGAYRNLKNALKSKIRKYNKSDLAINPSLLLLDLTWAINSENVPLSKNLSEEIEYILGSTHLGSFDHIICFWFGSDRKSNSAFTQSIRYPNQVQEENLKIFVDKFFSLFVSNKKIIPALPNLPNIRFR